MKRLKRVLPIFLAFILILFTACENKTDVKGDKESSKKTFHGKTLPLVLSNELEIVDAFLYNDSFPEDGSLAIKEDVFSLKVVNKSDKYLQLVRIYVTTDVREYFFEITTLPAGKAVTVCEKNGQTISQKEKIIDVREENKVFFEREISLNSDKFKITPIDSVLNIENISGQDMIYDVYVYYKQKDADGNYLGGITFRSNAGKLKAGEFKQISASQFSKENSEVMFVDYGVQ